MTKPNTPDHPGWKLSRECIRDTLMAKRTGIFSFGGPLPAICAHTLRMLRETQLAPHKEQKMTTGRYLKQQQEKQAAPEIVIVIRGGMVEDVFSTNPNTLVYIADYDLLSCDEEDYAYREKIEERVAKGDMRSVM